MKNLTLNVDFKNILRMQYVQDLFYVTIYNAHRNIGNYLSYNYSYVDVSNSKRENTYSYTFIEQDHLDAR